MKTNPESKTSDSQKQALKFLSSLRGNYIVGRALYDTYLRIKNEEPSDASDMEYLGKNLFNLGWLSASLFKNNYVGVFKQVKKSKLGKRK
jgi:hypothetical protein